MVFDLRAMLLRKGEFESARLDDFEFRQRVRAVRMFAMRREVEAAPLIAQIALGDDARLLGRLLEGLSEGEADALTRDWFAARADAYRELVEELGDPTPIRMA